MIHRICFSANTCFRDLFLKSSVCENDVQHHVLPIKEYKLDAEVYFHCYSRGEDIPSVSKRTATVAVAAVAQRLRGAAAAHGEASGIPAPSDGARGLSTTVRLGVRVSKISKLANFAISVGKILQIFGGLVLGCIKTKFCKKICV